ncbi:cytokine-inducible SH2-containing protein [Lampris incognitus]|uniref:cytokine-inducible SH2-containing protein n=1 Tax=Lampris incognitus TaxID=2546036 RepID=UPI0024B566D4|nr:cytokine-inducible SH2-containing protein [Lampris incognitus]
MKLSRCLDHISSRRVYCTGNKQQPDLAHKDLIQSMILCVQGPTSLLPTGPPSDARLGMRTGNVSPSHCLQSTPPLWDPTKDLRAIASNFCYLENSGWYWGAITAAQAHATLQEATEGAFLVRDSSHPLYMLTLSVRTARGPTSIRIQYSGAQFLLDSSSPARPSLLSFADVPSLVQHYMGPGRKVEEGKVEDAPSKPSQQTNQETSVVLKLTKAMYKPQGAPSLQHLTRLVINRHSDCPDQLPLPRPLLRYLKDYPFKV